MISALKQKLEIMESFHCSSSSFDALNSFQERRSSSVVVIAENEQIPSPTFKSLKFLESSFKNSKFSTRIGQKYPRNNSESFPFYCSQQPINCFANELTSFPTSRSASILPSFKQGKFITIYSTYNYCSYFQTIFTKEIYHR